MRRAICIAAIAAWTLALLGCGEPDLEVRGTTARVVGETVKLELTQGSTPFSDALELIDSSGRRFDKATLRSAIETDRKVSLMLPPGAATGTGIVQVGRTDGGTYDVRLNIGRFAVALDSLGKVEALPLPGSEVGRTEVQAGPAGKQASIAPSGAQLVTLLNDDVKVFNLGRELSSGGAGLIVSNAKAVVAVDGGAIVGTDAQALVLSFKQGAGTQQDASFVVGNVSSVAADATGKRAVVLSSCDTDNDTQPDSDCVWPIALDGSNSTLGQVIAVDNAPSAKQIAIATVDNAGTERQLIVVADGDRIYGITIDGALAPQVRSIAWPGNAPNSASAVAIDVGTSSLGPLFAIADASNSRVQTVGFDGDQIKPVSTLPVPAAPSSLSYGRGARLYVAAGNKLYFADVGASNEPKLEQIGVESTQPIQSLAVQK
ncbi:MAG: hypothetical protein KC503_43615 [Myxococcales bacterium]|nr:hypothetical protein [Myxococcales bacterium]